MRWKLSWSTDPIAREIADRHYNRQKPGSRRFMPPGRCFVLLSDKHDAVWGTSWPYAEYVRHVWAGAWINSIFRNEGDYLSSELIREAVAATRWYYPDVPDLGMVTFVNTDEVRPKKDPGYTYLMAGFKRVGKTQGGLIALQLLPEEMPKAREPILDGRKP